MKHFVIIFIFLNISFYTLAQFDADLSDTIFTKTESPQTLAFDFRSSFFLRNNEYFNNLYDGITFLGTQINPSLYYTFHPNISLSLGWYLRVFNGRNKFYINSLWYQLTYRFNSKLKLHMGNLCGYEHHRLIEPILSGDFQYLNPPENGIQFLYQSTKYKGDLWVNWQRFILPGDTFKEEFLLGYSSQYNLIQNSDKYTLSLPIQFLAKHKGGQVDKLELPMQTFFNWDVGIDFSNSINIHNKIGLSMYYVQFNDVSDSLLLQYKDGYGILSNLYFKSNLFDIFAGFWRAEYYYSPVGEPLFQSISTKYVAYNESLKQLILFKFQYKKRFAENLPLYLRFESYIDPQRAYFDFSYSLIIKVNERRKILLN